MRRRTLLEEYSARDTDNPFSPDYMLDAIGSTARAVYAARRSGDR